MEIPRFLQIKTKGGGACFWARFETPHVPSGKVKRSTGIMISDLAGARRLSEALARLKADKRYHDKTSAAAVAEAFVFNAKAASLWFGKTEAELRQIAATFTEVRVTAPGLKPGFIDVDFERKLDLGAALIQSQDDLADMTRQRDEALRGHPEKDKIIADLRAQVSRITRKFIDSTGGDGQPELSFARVLVEHYRWGKAQGGHGNRPWSPIHRRNRRARLLALGRALKFRVLGDLAGSLKRFEEYLRSLKSAGRTGRTLDHYVESMSAFIKWCKSRGYIGADPLAGLTSFDRSPVKTRRLMTDEEIRRLLDVAPEHRRLVYEVAFCSGLRANELRSLRESHLDEKRCGLRLDAKWTKNRKPGFQPLPVDLVTRLKKAVEEKLAQRSFERFKGKTRYEKPADALLYVPVNTSRDFDKDMKTAGLEKKTAEGSIDFHAARVAYTSMVIDSGASVKEAQVLARHSTSKMTMEVYARTTDARLASVAELVGQRILAAVPPAVPSEPS